MLNKPVSIVITGVLPWTNTIDRIKVLRTLCTVDAFSDVPVMSLRMAVAVARDGELPFRCYLRPGVSTTHLDNYFTYLVEDATPSVLKGYLVASEYDLSLSSLVVFLSRDRAEAYQSEQEACGASLSVFEVTVNT